MADFKTLGAKFGFTKSSEIGAAIEWAVTDALKRRQPHERRWYDNNFFDDGMHFRTVSRKTGAVIDHTSRNSQYAERAIPRASRQIRGIANLLFAAEPYPVVYPKRVTTADFQDPNEYKKAVETNKITARKQGLWLSNEWEEQELATKMIDLILLAAKNSVSWLQVYSDSEKQKIITTVYDAFDVICYGDVREHEDLPFIIKSCPMELQQIMADPRFDPKEAAKLSPDNKYATSQTKNAYMTSRYGSKESDPKKGTNMVNEAFMKDILTDDNWKEAIRLSSETGAMEGKSRGDMIMRHTFSSDMVALSDEYVDYDKYPLVPFRFEPGALYQVPFIERFIPQNKSIDVIITRLEKWVNAMVVGVYQVRKGENIQVSNFPGGQKIEYEGTPLSQMQMSTVSNTPFQVIDLLNKFMDEQGATTAGGQNLPQGVKSGVAIESVKATEYANLKITTLMLKKTLKSIAERMLERADKDYLKPQEVTAEADGEPDYFDVIGARGAALHEKIGAPLPQNTVVLDKSVKVKIEIEAGLGLTMEGKKMAMDTIISKLLEFNQIMPGMIPPEALQMVIKKFLEEFGYGATQELMEALEQGMTQGEMQEEQITKMKIAIVEALRDSGAIGKEAAERMVDTTKIGILEALKDAGILDKLVGEGGEGEGEQGKPPSRSIPYKDLPPEGKAQMAAQAGIQLDPNQIRADEEKDQQKELALAAAEMQQRAQEHSNNMVMRQQESDQKMSIQREQMQMKDKQASAGNALKEKALKQKPKTNGVKK